MTERIRGGFRGILSAIEAAWLDPDDGTTPERDRGLARSSADQRARELRDHRRAKRDAKRSPF